MRNWKGAWKLDDKIFLFLYQKKIAFFIKKKSTTVWQLEGSKKKKKSVWRGGGSSMATERKYMKFLLHKLWCGLSQSAKMAVEEDGFPSLSQHKVRISCTSLIFWANLVFFCLLWLIHIIIKQRSSSLSFCQNIYLGKYLKHTN